MSSMSVPDVDHIFEPKLRGRWPSWTFWVICGILGVGLFFALVVPTMCRSSVAANRIKSSSNLRQIGIALQMYANAHYGGLPHDFADLANDSGELPAEVFVSPSSNDDRAEGKQVAAWSADLLDPTKHCCSYRYLADGVKFNEMNQDDILAIEPVEVNDGDGFHVLFRSGNVDWIAARVGTESGKPYQKLLSDYAAGVRPIRLTNPT